jgi:membrane-bound lytic murein transglycosylase D
MRTQLVAVAALIWAGTPLTAQPDTTVTLDGWSAGRPEVTRYLDYFQGAGRARMQQWLDRGTRYRGQIREQLDREGLPSEFEFLPMIESGYSNTARSRVGAEGMWQFMPGTARDYGLRVDRLVDERRHPDRATNAAIRHLGDLQRTFGSPTLTAAAYNSGLGRIRSILSRAGDDDEPTGADSFLRLARRGLLPDETARYLPQLIAAATIGRDPARYGFTVDSTPAAAIDSVAVKRPTRLAALARAADLDPDLLRSLNPELVGGVTPPGGRWLRVPADRSDTLRALVPTLPTVTLPVGGIHRITRLGALIRVGRGETLAAIAARHGVNLETLRRMNALPKTGRLRVGQALRLPAR